MITPELTYRYQLPKDSAQGTCDLIFRQGVAIGTITPQAVTYTVPGDRVLALGTVTLLANAGGFQFPKRHAVTVTIAQQVFTVVATSAITSAPAAGESAFTQTFTGLWVPPGATLILQHTFTGADASNNVAATFQGTLIPRGNVQFS